MSANVKRCLSGCLIALMVLAMPLSAWAVTVQSWRLENGAKVLLVERHANKIVDINVAFDAGSRRDEAAHLSVADFAGGLMDAGAGEWDEEDLRQKTSALAVSVNSYPGLEWAGVRLRSLSDAKTLGEAVQIANTILTRPRYEDKILAREKNNAVLALRQNLTDPGFLAARSQNRLNYPTHPYGYGGRENEAALNAVSREQLAAFHRKHYSTDHAVVAIVGDISREEAQTVAQTLLGGLPEHAPQALAPLPAVPKSLRQFAHIPHPAQQAHIVLGLPLIKRDDPDYFPLLVGNYTLGGGGFDSRLMKVLRDQKGLTYGAGSGLAPMQEAGEFTVSVATRREQSQQALTAARQIIRDFIVQGPSETELKQAKDNLIGGFPLRIDSNAKLVGYLTVMGVYDLPLSYLDDYPRHVAAVTADQVREAWQRRVNPDDLNITVVGGAPLPNPYTDKPPSKQGQ